MINLIFNVVRFRRFVRFPDHISLGATERLTFATWYNNYTIWLSIMVYSPNIRTSDTDKSIVGHCETSRSAALGEHTTLVRCNGRNRPTARDRRPRNHTRCACTTNVHWCTCSWYTPWVRTIHRRPLRCWRFCYPCARNLECVGGAGKDEKHTLTITITETTTKAYSNHRHRLCGTVILTRFAFWRGVTSVGRRNLRRAFAFIRAHGVHARSRWVTSVIVCRAFVDIWIKNEQKTDVWKIIGLRTAGAGCASPKCCKWSPTI
jgi:hypothetical protein